MKESEWTCKWSVDFLVIPEVVRKKPRMSREQMRRFELTGLLSLCKESVTIVPVSLQVEMQTNFRNPTQMMTSGSNSIHINKSISNNETCANH